MDTDTPLGADASALLQGTTHGRVAGPGSVNPPLPPRDAREEALRALRKFISCLEFRLYGDSANAPGVAFKIPLASIHVYAPDAVQARPKFQGVGILPGHSRREPVGLGPPPVIDGTEDVYGPGVVLVGLGYHVETFGIEVRGEKHAEVVAVVAGLRAALSMGDGSQALQLKLPGYYDRVAAFRLDEGEAIDDGEDAATERRRSHLFVELTVPEVQPVAYRRLVVLPQSDVVDEL